ncbi:uncharacterized protein LOC112090207 [Eutrema salsugineum]|uniref:uncharacterized protein LOC112090207 n=1 Tax=Eutrema salsugineum TaxID=72664 RepID=UPI000CED18AA|nr:uncharacterized protein LOC112090207 [Eutrema salsugineum]
MGFQKNFSNKFQAKPFIPNHNRFQGGNQQPFANVQKKPSFTNMQPGQSSANSSQDELKNMMQQLLVNQQKASTEINSKVDSMYNNLNGKFEAVWTHMKKLDIQIAQTAEAVKRPPRTLPGKTAPPTSTYKRKGIATEQVLGPETSDPGQDKVDRREHPETSTEHVLRPSDQARSTDTPPARVYMPRVPYPVPPKKSQKDLEDAKCREMLRDLTLKIPLVDAVQMVPALKRFMKGLVSGRVSEEENVMMVSRECSAVLQNKVLKKRDDPGRFFLSVKIGNTVFARSLCNLGSSVNLMLYSVAKRLGYTKFKSTRISLVFADRSTKFPIGVLEDLHVKIGDTLILADFVVLELDEEPRDPLILGRSFLSTAGAIIDVHEGIIDLQLGDMIVRFEMDKLLKKPMIDGQTFVIDDGSDVADEVADKLLALDPLETVLTKAEGEFGFLSEEAEVLARMLDASAEFRKLVAYASLDNEEDSAEKSAEGAPAPNPGAPAPAESTDGPWSELRAPKIELKPLPAGLRYPWLLSTPLVAKAKRMQHLNHHHLRHLRSQTSSSTRGLAKRASRSIS